MALFKVSKGLAKNLTTNVPNAKEGFAYFTTDDGKFYIDIAGDGTSTTKAEIGTNRIPLNAYASDLLKASEMPTNDNIVYPILAFNLKDTTKNLIEAKYTQIGIKNGSLVIPNVAGKDEILISNTGAGRGIVIDNTNGTGHAIEITAGKGIKVAKDPVDNLELTTKQYVDKILSANDAMIFKGILDNTHNLPDTHETGWTYRVNKAGTYAGKVCEIGDLVICIADGLSANDSHWTVAQTNIDGAVIGPNTSTANAVSTFADATGKVIKNNLTVTINDTGLFTAPYIATGTDKTHYFQSAKFRGEGNANTYYHAIDFGYSGHNQVDFHEYGGIWNFYRNTKGTAADGELVASIQPNGFHGNLNGNATTATTATKAGSADKVNNNLVIKLNSGTTEGTNQFTYNGSAAKDINITPANIGAASNSHNHDSNYVKKTGDTMSGKITFKFTTSKPARGVRLPVLSGQYQNGSGAYYSTDLVDMIGTASTNVNNAAVRFGSTNGATFITSGEGGCVFPSKLNSNLVDCEDISFCANGGFNFWGNISNNGSTYTSYMNMSGSKITAYQPLYGAVWNDYAEFREGDTIEPGKCVIEVGDDTLITSTERMMPGANITSDTFGFAIGETEQAKTPIAVSGRVLAYPYESHEEFKKNIGRPVCSGPDGTVSIMTDEEYRDKGYCAIGTISAVPDYEEWGTGKVKVNGRVWIKVF